MSEMSDRDYVIAKIKDGAKPGGKPVEIFFYDQTSGKPSNISACLDGNCDKMMVDDLGHVTYMAHCRAHNWKAYVAGKCVNKVLHGAQAQTTAAGTELYPG